MPKQMQTEATSLSMKCDILQECRLAHKHFWELKDSSSPLEELNPYLYRSPGYNPDHVAWGRRRQSYMGE